MLETVFETDRLRLTNWLPEHFDDLMRLHCDPEVIRYISMRGKPENAGESRRRFDQWAELFAARRMGKLRVTDKISGAFLGRAGFGIFEETDEPELGYAFLRENWGKGYASEAAAGLRDWFFENTPDDGFIGFADIQNAVSIHVLQKIGMRPTRIATLNSSFVCQFHEFTREQWHGR